VVSGWFPDPAARHAQRYFDGERWTEHVATTTGQMTTDPIWLAAPPPVVDAPPGPPSFPTGYAAGPPPYPPMQPYLMPIRRTNELAIASLILGIVWLCWVGSVLAVVFGHIAINQIKASQGMQEGRGMAIAGLVLGYLGLGFLLLTMLAG
jgi:hypothetical protein